MAGEDLDIEKAINEFSNRFIDEMSLSKTITYATRQLGFEKVIEHQKTALWPPHKKWKLRAQRK